MELWTADERLNYIYSFCKFDSKDITLDFWQDNFIRDKSKFIALLKSRQTGFSFIVAAKGLVKAIDPTRTKYTKQFVSYNEEDAQEKIRYAREFYDSIPSKYKKRLLHCTSTMLEFEDVGGHTTSRLISLPCRPPRGRNGDVCLDEFAIYTTRQSKEIYTAASFCTLRKGCIEVGSTPLGTIGQFYEIYSDKERYDDFVRYFVPWWYASVMCKDVDSALKYAINMDTDERVHTFGKRRLLDLYNNSTIDDFQQECECVFVDSAMSYIPMDLILANTPGRREEDIPQAPQVENIDDADDTKADEKHNDEYYNAKRDIEIETFKDADDLIAGYDMNVHGKTLYMGYDVARDRDAAALYIIGIVDGKKKSVMRFEKRDMPFEEQKDTFCRLMRTLPIHRACMDSTGMGAPLCEQLKHEFGDRVEGVLFTAQTKETLAIDVKLGLERLEFLLPNDRDFHAQIHKIKRTPTSGGGFRYDAERDSKGHADSFWAWALANHAINNVTLRPSFYAEYTKSKNSGDSWEERRERQLPHRRGRSLDRVLYGFGIN